MLNAERLSGNRASGHRLLVAGGPHDVTQQCGVDVEQRPRQTGGEGQGRRPAHCRTGTETADGHHCRCRGFGTSRLQKVESAGTGRPRIASKLSPDDKAALLAKLSAEDDDDNGSAACLVPQDRITLEVA
jgi:hypothetical protein